MGRKGSDLAADAYCTKLCGGGTFTGRWVAMAMDPGCHDNNLEATIRRRAGDTALCVHACVCINSKQHLGMSSNMAVLTQFVPWGMEGEREKPRFKNVEGFLLFSSRRATGVQ